LLAIWALKKGRALGGEKSVLVVGKVANHCWEVLLPKERGGEAPGYPVWLHRGGDFAEVKKRSDTRSWEERGGPYSIWKLPAPPRCAQGHKEARLSEPGGERGLTRVEESVGGRMNQTFRAREKLEKRKYKGKVKKKA